MGLNNEYDTVLACQAFNLLEKRHRQINHSDVGSTLCFRSGEKDT